MRKSEVNKPTVPYRQIRALYNSDTITLYQAYSATIAISAVADQRLDASPTFSVTRMTWLKPSWCWMMYRSGYSFKDANQSHILALTMSHAHFRELLMHAVVCRKGTLTKEQKAKDVRVQWDPERGPRIEHLEHRSLQVGVSRDVGRKMVRNWIVGIEDVTERAREMKQVVDEEGEAVDWGMLVKRGLVLEEREYAVDDELRRVLEMDER